MFIALKGDMHMQVFRVKIEDITFILSATQMENFQIISLMMDNYGFSFNVFNVGSTPKCGGRVSGRHTRVR
jgi:hypothetical protein